MIRVPPSCHGTLSQIAHFAQKGDFMKYRFKYFVGGFYDSYQSFEIELDDYNSSSLIIIAKCPLGRSPRAFINLNLGSDSYRDSDLEKIISEHLDYCYRI